MKTFYLFGILTILASGIACSFPEKSLVTKSLLLSKDLTRIKDLITTEYKGDKKSLPIDNITNTELRQILTSYQLDEISIRYLKSPDTTPYAIYKNDLHHSYDSTIIMSWINSSGDRTTFKHLIYFFSTQKPIHIANKDEKQLNDSLWLQKSVSDLIITY